jgi:long-chain acyl-CoA synthetase
MSLRMHKAEPGALAARNRPQGRTLQSFLAGLSEHGERQAIVQMAEGRSSVLCYDELGTRVARFAAGVERAGIERGEAVVLFAGGGQDWIVACLGLMGAGAVPVPLDTQLDAKTLRRVFDSCQPRWVLTEAAHVDRLDASGYDGGRLQFDAPDGDPSSWRGWLAGEPGTLPELDPEDHALLFFTSGTTGPPKGVPLKHRHLAFQLEIIAEAKLVAASDRVLQPLPLHHVYPLVVGTLAPLSLGLPIILPQGMTGPELARALNEGEVTFIIGVPRLYGALDAGIRNRLEQAPVGFRALLKGALALSVWLRRRFGVRAGKRLLYPLHRKLAPRLRVVASGGSALDAELAWRLEGLGWQVAVGYGLTETSPLLTLNPPGTPVLESVGRPISGIEVRIDPSAHPGGSNTVPGREEGEILARGESVFDGYLGREHERDSDDFTPDGWYRTGDLGWMDADGYLYVTGRVKTLIVTGAGKNIVPEELEDAYAEHPLIEEIGVLGGDQGLLAVIVPAQRETASRDVAERAALRQAVKEVSQRLPSYKRLSHYAISHQPLARTRLGKIQRHLLAEQYQRLLESGGEDEKPGPMPVEEMRAEDRELVRDEAARKVWELLARRYPDRRLTPDSSMQLDLGVDSLGWLDLSTELAQRTGVGLAEDRIAQIDSVRDLLLEVSRSPKGEVDMKAPLEDPEAVLNEQQLRWLEPLSRGETLLSRLLYGLNRGLMRSTYRLKITGLENLPRDAEQLIIAPNHTSYLDPFAVAAALPQPVLRRTFWGGWTGAAFRNALFRRASRLAHAVPIDPDRAAISSLAFAAAILRRGDNLVWFPEGERAHDGRLGEIRPGLGLLLEKFDRAIVVPAHIGGAFEAWPRSRRLPRLGALSINFDRPLRAEELAQCGQGEETRTRIINGLGTKLAALAEQPPPARRSSTQR